jgi:Phasin protein
MSNADAGKPAGKSGQRSRKGERGKKTVSKKGPPERPAPVQAQRPDQDQPLQPQPVHAESPKVHEPPAIVDEPVAAVAASPEPPPAAAPSPAEPATAQPALAGPPAPAKPATAELTPVSLQTIANAYSDYTRKSFEDFGSFFEQLSGARSLDKAMSVHTEFVKRAYETSVAESQKICELHTKLARQTLEPFQGFAGKARKTGGKS